MNKYIDADKLTKVIKDKGLDCSFALKMERLDILAIIDELQQVADASKMEQEEVDIEREIENEWKKCYPTDEGMGLESANIVNEQFDAIARHFYGLRNRALEEAARHVYESWMGGTMDDVRRDMVELGTVLNARKEE